MDITSYLLGKNAGGGSEINNQNKNVTITTNGSSTVSADAGYTGLGTVGITTNVQPNLESKSVTITENTTTTITPTSGKDGLSSVSVTTNVSGGGDLDWSALGFNGTPQGIKDGYNYAVEIMNNWVATTTTLGDIFSSDYKLVIFPQVDTSNLTNMISGFYGCYALTSIALINTSNVTRMNECFRECRALIAVPKFNTSKVTNMQKMFANCYSLTTVPLLDTSAITGNSSLTQMFSNCNSLTDASLDNILQMCINATGYTGTKTLSTLAIMSTNIYPASRIQALPHYQDFINAGWTIS